MLTQVLVLLLIIIAISTDELQQGQQLCHIVKNSTTVHPIRATVLSVNTERYTNCKSVLEDKFNGLVVNRYYPIPWDAEALEQRYRHDYQQFLNCKRTADGERVWDSDADDKQVLSVVEKKVISNMIGFIDLLFDFAAEPRNVSDENDWMLIFEDDIGVHPGAREPTCDVLQGLEMAKREGLAFLGRCGKLKCNKAEKRTGEAATGSETKISRCFDGTCAHAWAVTKWKARLIPGAALALICQASQPAYMDVGLLLISQKIHPTVFIGENLDAFHEVYKGNGKFAKPEDDHSGLVFQDRAKYPTTIG